MLETSRKRRRRIINKWSKLASCLGMSQHTKLRLPVFCYPGSARCSQRSDLGIPFLYDITMRKAEETSLVKTKTGLLLRKVRVDRSYNYFTSSIFCKPSHRPAIAIPAYITKDPSKTHHTADLLLLLFFAKLGGKTFLRNPITRWIIPTEGPLSYFCWKSKQSNAVFIDMLL